MMCLHPSPTPFFCPYTSVRGSLRLCVCLAVSLSTCLFASVAVRGFSVAVFALETRLTRPTFPSLPPPPFPPPVPFHSPVFHSALFVPDDVISQGRGRTTSDSSKHKTSKRLSRCLISSSYCAAYFPSRRTRSQRSAAYTRLVISASRALSGGCGFMSLFSAESSKRIPVFIAV